MHHLQTPVTATGRQAACAWQLVEFDAELLSRLDKSGPRYTSYPTADRFSDAFGYRDGQPHAARA